MKKALLTTTALVALNSAAFASSIDTPVNSASSTHHTHSAATIVWTGDANIKYNVPLKSAAGQSVDGVVASDVDLDVTMTSPGAYSATISWFTGATNSTFHDEIVVHRAGHAPNNGDVQFRTLRASGSDTHDLMLQVKHNQSYSAAPDQTSGKTFKFKFRKMI